MTVAIVQARLGSSRLPGKTMAPIVGKPMLWHVINRVRKATLVERVVVATTDSASDDSIAEFCAQTGVPCYRGSEHDVLDRFYQAANANAAESVVRITADCPLIDPEVIDEVIRCYRQGRFDYVSNTIRYTYPDGLDTEVFSLHALERAWREAHKRSEREHVTPYLRSGKFRVANVASDQPVPTGRHRWTVDDLQDLEFIREIYEAFADRAGMSFREILDFLSKRSDVAAIQSAALSNEGYYRSLYREAATGPAKKLQLRKSEAWFARTQNVIPGGAQTFSKSSSQYVQGAAPLFLERGKGCRVWDADGNEYIDYVQGLLPNILGYANEEVNRAVAEQIAEGHSFSLPHRLEVELAERLTRLIPCAEMVRFGKNGSDATSGAIRAARAFTGRDYIACCGYHGWQDWYIGSTTRNAGVPEAVRRLTHSFRYNDISSLQSVFREYPNQFAAVIMEPVNFTEPKPGFLETVKEMCQSQGTLLIFDEICSGFHFGLGGAQKRYGVTPDLACFGKAMGNGFPISCVVGRAEVMRTFEEIFFSFTFAGEVASMAAAMKVLDVLETTDALARMEANGRTLQDGINTFAAEAGIGTQLKCLGFPSWSLMKFTTPDGADDAVVKNLFQQEAIKRGILVLTTHNMTAAHDDTDVHHTLEAYAAVVKTVAGWLQESNPARFLEGEMSRPVFRVR